MRTHTLSLLFFFTLAACQQPKSSTLSVVTEGATLRFQGTTGHLPLRSVFSGKVADVRDLSTVRGALVQQWSYATQANQQWQMQNNPDGTYTFRVKHTGQCLDLYGFNPDDAAPVAQWDCNGKVNQKWRVAVRNGALEIRSAWNDKCLDVLGFQTDNGAGLGVWTCKGAENQLWTLGGAREMQTLLKSTASARPAPAEAVVPAADYPLNQIVGTQVFGPAYQFTNEDPILEAARGMAAMGSRMVKLTAREGAVLDTILEMPFDRFFFWWRSSSPWFDGLSAAESEAEYQATYAFAKKLLTRFAQDNKEIFLGHWEGDWYLLPDYNTNINPSQTAIDGMVAWLNIRQKAIEDARRDVPGSRAKVYQYTEVNRVRDAMVGGKQRLVNTVLPRVNVDFVSYSCYDVQQENVGVIRETIDYIEARLQPKAGLGSGRRVFIGEFGLPALNFGYDSQEHERRNREIMIKLLDTGVPYILYWAFYNNEVRDGQQRGFWLINDKGVKQPLYYTFQELYQAQATESQLRQVRSFNGLQSFTRQWLNNR